MKTKNTPYIGNALIIMLSISTDNPAYFRYPLLAGIIITLIFFVAQYEKEERSAPKTDNNNLSS